MEILDEAKRRKTKASAKKAAAKAAKRMKARTKSRSKSKRAIKMRASAEDVKEQVTDAYDGAWDAASVMSDADWESSKEEKYTIAEVAEKPAKATSDFLEVMGQWLRKNRSLGFHGEVEFECEDGGKASGGVSNWPGAAVQLNCTLAIPCEETSYDESRSAPLTLGQLVEGYDDASSALEQAISRAAQKLTAGSGYISPIDLRDGEATPNWSYTMEYDWDFSEPELEDGDEFFYVYWNCFIGVDDTSIEDQLDAHRDEIASDPEPYDW